jgi:hypothetical protein
MTLQQVDIGRSSPSGAINRYKGSIAALNIPSIAAASVVLVSVAVPNVKPGDVVLLVPLAADLSVAVGILPGYCLAAGTAKFPTVNPTAGALDPASQDFTYILMRSAS